MQIDFEDGSFIMFEYDEKKHLDIIMCGKKDENKVVMSSSSLTKEQVKLVADFFNKCLAIK